MNRVHGKKPKVRKPFKKKKNKRMSFSEYVTKEDTFNVEQTEKNFQAYQNSKPFHPVNVNTELFSSVKISSLKNTLSSRLISQLSKMNIHTLTTIQEKSLQKIVSGQNVFMKSVTGSGKTLGFIIPLVQRLLSDIKNGKKMSRKDGVTTIIISPTRELSMQTFNVLKSLTNPFPYMVSGMICGGTNVKSEKKRIRKGLTFIVGTPGRLLYHFKNTQSLSLHNIRHIILDEADVLLEMGYERDIKEIVQCIYDDGNIIFSNIQKLLISATLDEKIKKLSEWLFQNEQVNKVSDSKISSKELSNVQQKKEKVIFIGQENAFEVPEKLNQFYMKVPAKLRLVCLVSFLLEKTELQKDLYDGVNDFKNEKKGKVIVFFSCCSSVDFHYELLSNFKKNEISKLFNNTKILKLHGNMKQSQRDYVYKTFSNSTTGILFTTDVFCRGMDLPSVNWIVQYDSPGNPKDYLHRATRTSRIGAVGNAVLFLMPHEIVYLKLLKKYQFQLNEISGEKVLQNLMLLFPHFKVNDQFYFAMKIQKMMEDHVRNNENVLELSKSAYKDYVRAYSTHSREVKYIFNVDSLHMGKLANSFALDLLPREIFQKGEKYEKRNKKMIKEEERNENVERRRRRKHGDEGEIENIKKMFHGNKTTNTRNRIQRKDNQENDRGKRIGKKRKRVGGNYRFKNNKKPFKRIKRK